LGEVAKYALISNALDELVDHEAGGIRGRDPGVLANLVASCVQIKADVVVRDPEERTGLRATLNYGHTLAHALEASAGFDDLLHGEAVAVGVVFAGALAAALGRIDDATADRHTEIVTALGLPTRAPEGLDQSKLRELMARDKKAQGGLTFVLLGPNGLERVDDPPAAALKRAFETVGVEG
jgi:5-deoxy-5-amino-3-dehydroquinate synthase